MTLSQELVDIIIGELDVEEDKHSLEICSLVSASFCHSSQARIFRRVTLQPWVTNKKTMCFLFHRLVTHSPHILRYVRVLIVQDRLLHTWVNMMGLPSWVLNEPTLPPLLQMLANLESLHFHAAFGWSSVCSNPSLSSAILNVLASSKIVSLHLRGLSIPSSCILRSPGLKSLLLNDLAVVDPHNIAVSPSGVQLRCLGLSGQILNWFAGAECPFNLGHLSRLRASPRPTLSAFEHSALQSLLNTCAKSLLFFEYLPIINGDSSPRTFRATIKRSSQTP
jgi:hypothetical protein